MACITLFTGYWRSSATAVIRSYFQDIPTSDDMEEGMDTQRSSPSSEWSGTPLPPLIIEAYNSKEREAAIKKFYDELVKKMHILYMEYYLKKIKGTGETRDIKDKETRDEDDVESVGNSENEEIFDARPVGDSENEEITDTQPVGDGESEEIVDAEPVEDVENEEIIDAGPVGDNDNEEAVYAEPAEDSENIDIVDIAAVGNSKSEEVADIEAEEDSENEEIVDAEPAEVSENEEADDLESQRDNENEQADDMESEGDNDNEEAEHMESAGDNEESAYSEDEGCDSDREDTFSDTSTEGIMNIPVQVMIHREREKDDESTKHSAAAVEEGSASKDSHDNGVIYDPAISAKSPNVREAQRENERLDEHEKICMNKGRDHKISNDISSRIDINLSSDEDNEAHGNVAHCEDKIHDKNIVYFNIDEDGNTFDDDEPDEEDHEARIEGPEHNTPEKEATVSEESASEPELEEMRTPRNYSFRQSIFSLTQQGRSQKRITNGDRRRERYNSFSRLSDGNDTSCNNYHNVHGSFSGQDISCLNEISNNVVRRTPQALSLSEGSKTGKKHQGPPLNEGSLSGKKSKASSICEGGNTRRKRKAPSISEGWKTKRLKTVPSLRTQNNKSFFIGKPLIYSLCRCEEHVCNYSKNND